LKRIVTRCVGFCSYQYSKDTLEELCAVTLSHTTIGKIADITAGEIADRLHDNPEVRDDFLKAKGETEFLLDGTFVHILNADGTKEWRESKLFAYAKRQRGESASVWEWESRKLPDVSVAYAFAAIDSKAECQERCQEARRCLGIGGVSSALGDGAKWIWNIVREVHGKTDECLDFYHAAEHVSACGKVLYGEGDAFKEWFERMRLVLLSEGFAGIDRELQLLESGLKGKSKKLKRVAIASLRTYLCGNECRLNYSSRLSAGRSIGSGLIEGACKNLVGKRLKQTGACWRVERANRIAIICAALYSRQWKKAWKKST